MHTSELEQLSKTFGTTLVFTGNLAKNGQKFSILKYIKKHDEENLAEIWVKFAKNFKIFEIFEVVVNEENFEILTRSWIKMEKNLNYFKNF